MSIVPSEGEEVLGAILRVSLPATCKLWAVAIKLSSVRSFSASNFLDKVSSFSPRTKAVVRASCNTLAGADTLRLAYEL